MNTRLLYTKRNLPDVESFDDLELLTMLLGNHFDLGTKIQEEIPSRIADAHREKTDVLVKLLEGKPDDFLRMGNTKTNAMKLACITELAKRMWKVKKGIKKSIDCAGAVADYFMQDLRYEAQEHAYIMYLNTRNCLIECVQIGLGSSDACAVSPRDIIRKALELKAAGMIMVHNHPSGDTSLSTEDIKFTKSLRDAGKLMEVQLKDSVIIGDNAYLSMMERGII